MAKKSQLARARLWPGEAAAGPLQQPAMKRFPAPSCPTTRRSARLWHRPKPTDASRLSFIS